MPRKGPAVVHRVAEGLALGNDDVGAHGAGALEESAHDGIGLDDEEGAGRVCRHGGLREVTELALEFGIGRHDAEDLVGNGGCRGVSAVFLDPDREGRKVGTDDVLVLGVEGGGDEDDIAGLGVVPGHEDGLREGGGAVVVRGVHHFHAEKLRGHGLVLEDGLERALGHLGLVGRIGGEELARATRGPATTEGTKWL